jgi:site-specific DNA-cytosine methylase
MRMLELFSGTGSVGSVFLDHGWEVISLDRDLPADINCDILSWDYQSTFPPNYFQFIWASPPCTEYSIAKTVGTRNIEESNKVVQRALDIIEYFHPCHWVMENPQTGLLKRQECIMALPFDDLDYCKYGMPYRKRTRLWNNIPNYVPRPLCKRDCPAIREDGKHEETAQQGKRQTNNGNREPNRHSRTELYKVPRELVEEIIASL